MLGQLPSRLECAGLDFDGLEGFLPPAYVSNSLVKFLVIVLSATSHNLFVSIDVGEINAEALAIVPLSYGIPDRLRDVISDPHRRGIIEFLCSNVQVVFPQLLTLIWRIIVWVQSIRLKNLRPEKNIALCVEGGPTIFVYDATSKQPQAK